MKHSTPAGPIEPVWLIDQQGGSASTCSAQTMSAGPIIRSCTPEIECRDRHAELVRGRLVLRSHESTGRAFDHYFKFPVADFPRSLDKRLGCVIA